MSPPPKDLPRAALVPQGRTRRLLHLGRAVGEMAAGAAAEGVARLARGEAAELSQLMLTPANARRLAERLSQMRGAVMKVGQLMSMDGHSLLPPQFAELLGGLRDRAHVMPATQLIEVLEREYGSGWHARFRRFSFEPVAAASIGQVHRAETPDGRVLALKIQYPGVSESIDSDVANLGLLARLPTPGPVRPDPTPMLERIRVQLHRETDYAAEAASLTAYREALGDDPVLTVPQVQADYCSAKILATDFAPGVAIDRLADPRQPREHRDHVAAALTRLSVREFFEMRLVQTDPNFGNYLFDADSGRIALIDFGATEIVSLRLVEQLRSLGRALRDGDAARIRAMSIDIGFIAEGDPPAQSQGLLDIMQLASEPLRHAGPYDFAASDLFKRSFAQGRAQFFGAGFARTPPPDILFLQRKFAGMFLMCARLGARVDLAEVFGAQL